MRISNPIVIKLVSLLSSWILRLWMSSQDYGFWADDPQALPTRRKQPGLYVFWHETLLFPAYTHARQGIAVLISRHRDGEWIAETLRMLGGRAIRGSTSRGGTAAVRRMLEHAQECHLAITPDGPRGPRRVVQIGAIYIASRSGMPVIPVGFALGGCLRLWSWDRMAFPRPGRAGRCVVGRPIDVPADLNRAGLETYRLRIQAALDDVQRRAERLADHGRWAKDMLRLRHVRR